MILTPDFWRGRYRGRKNNSSSRENQWERGTARGIRRLTKMSAYNLASVAGREPYTPSRLKTLDGVNDSEISVDEQFNTASSRLVCAPLWGPRKDWRAANGGGHFPKKSPTVATPAGPISRRARTK